MPDSLSFYLKKIQRLRVDRARGIPAPHKPLLLLAVIDLIEQGTIDRNQIEPSPQLVDAFLKYWTCISTKQARPFFPFQHLISSRFWHLHPKPGQENILAEIQQFKSMPQLARVVAYASFDDELFSLLINPQTREVIRQAIIDTYFPEQRDMILSVVNETRELSDLEKAILKRAEESKPVDARHFPETPLRSAAFRGVIMKLYDYTCSACHLRIITLNGASAVDAAHIIPFAESHDDSVGNGLALCKLHHWAFDIGLISLDEGYHLLVSNAFEEKGPSAMLLSNLRAQRILLPSQKPFFPSLQSIRYHREKKFQQ